jgi:hypothetical protein
MTRLPPAPRNRHFGIGKETVKSDDREKTMCLKKESIVCYRENGWYNRNDTTSRRVRDGIR